MENENFYMILNSSNVEKEYPGFKPTDVKIYDSSTAERITFDELESIIMEYVEKGN